MKLLTALLVSSTLAAPALAVDAKGEYSPITFDVTFMSHVEAGMTEQDVYVARNPLFGRCLASSRRFLRFRSAVIRFG